ncbi:protoporphyrinogen oxidase [Cryobacterium melibiosiphilum]|uniref:Coproporphyrinogen III oxidase n=1 Tax=Cryobacterium melibiosiphilum TaxID=995039 RepID=A0A3A5MKX4_9MICO|nr:protoporphyrinogen oxidase [Cryobacterium melibiosiphilum]RJT87503.1 protoporphyrinogen oxidase [Cryobacterium melibiosiphilum]
MTHTTAPPEARPAQTRVVIVGAGISGLTTAYYLQRRFGDQAQITLVEAAERLGGKISTRIVAGHPLDTGPDALMVRAPVAAALIADLGLADQVVAPNGGGARIWSRGRLRSLPEGTMFGVPGGLLPLVRSRLLSPLGLARAAFDLVLPRNRPRAAGADPSIGELVRARMGAQVFNRLVEPLLGGVHAGRADTLSAQSTAPDIAALASTHRSLYLGLRHRPKRAAGAAPAGPMLVTLNSGLGGLVDALEAHLTDATVRRGRTVTAITPAAGPAAAAPRGYRVDLDDGDVLTADVVVLATPAFASAQIVATASPQLATLLEGIDYANVATIGLAYPRSALSADLVGTGFLVPPEEGRLIVGCTWSSLKWPHLADDNVVLVRCMVGRHGDNRWLTMRDSTLVRRVRDELADALGLVGTPQEQFVQRWDQGMPQYLVGHQTRLDAMAEELTTLPGLFLTGSAYRGVGLASCIADAERTADAIVAVRSSTRREDRAGATIAGRNLRVPAHRQE